MTTSVCPFSKAARPDDASASRKQADTTPSVCPFSKADASARKQGETTASGCPFSKSDASARKQGEVASKGCPVNEGRVNKEEDSTTDSATVPAKCPFGYDSQTFKLGPFSCMLCQALLYDSSRCVPCTHVFCKVCVARFKDCPLCGADVESIEADESLQKMVDQFIEGHARIKRSVVNSNDKEEVENDNKKVIYADVSMERGSFLVQQAMRAFQAQNYESAKSRLAMCTEDIRDQLKREGNTPELCSQLGAVLGMLGDCSRAMGDSSSAVNHFEESIEFLMKLPMDDLEITHTLSVSLNKIGDLKYYGQDLEAARSYYCRALNVRRDAMKHHPNAPSQILDVAVSLAKVADIDRALQHEDAATDGFKEGMKLLESLKLDSEDSAPLEQRRLSVLEFLKKQVEKPAETAI
ncbi:protein NCA1 [Brassica rapa]|uniref:RING-type domain-containing protein n=1 Tax=Brassica campestris TaxID=3711 RepID=M4CS76_BRACM|nr:protein NCA1 [Brassica rapa]